MFTGIVEEVGEIAEVEPLGAGRALRVRATRVREGTRTGDSIAIDGACLTVTRLDPEGFAVEAVATTLERTILGEYGPGRRVNLERALAFGERLGGHLVQGHVDGVGTVLAVEPRGELVTLDVRVPPEVAAVTIPRGSITVNGISLTVAELPEPDLVRLSIVPFTWEHTALPDLSEGARVNLEGDLIGKYVRHLLGAPGEPPDLRAAWGYQ